MRRIAGCCLGALQRRYMATAADAAHAAAPPPDAAARLWAAVFPGEAHDPADAASRARLAARLRHEAAALEAGPPAAAAAAPAAAGRAAAGKDLDFGAFQRRHVALEVLYVGHRYFGFARQTTTDETVEGHLFAALRKTRLVPPGDSWQELRYSRGGRTDKGVSALGNVVALLLRSAARAGGAAGAVAEPLPPPERELDYPALLNRALPPDIRVLGWADVPAPDFSARFSARCREYKYLLPAAGLDAARMRAAAAAFVGDHDFRNFCKADVVAVRSWRRTVHEVRLEPAGPRLLQLYIRGSAFLWHQVRCMAAVLAAVGRGDEDPGVVAALLDVGATPRKPQYALAPEEPLLLAAVGYEGLRWRRTAANHARVAAALDDALVSHLTRAGLLRIMAERLRGDECAPDGGGGGAGKRRRVAAYVPLLQRPCEPSIEEKQAALGARLGAAANGDEEDEEG